MGGVYFFNRVHVPILFKEVSTLVLGRRPEQVAEATLARRFSNQQNNWKRFKIEPGDEPRKAFFGGVARGEGREIRGKNKDSSAGCCWMKAATNCSWKGWIDLSDSWMDRFPADEASQT